MDSNSSSSAVLPALALQSAVPLTEQPAAVYLSGLKVTSRRAMRQALDTIAELLTDGKCDAMTLDWAALRYRHTAAVRAALCDSDKYSPKTINNMLCALRRVLKEAFRLELMNAENYARAVDIKSVKLHKLLRGRALSTAEITALMEVCFNDPSNLGKRDTALIVILRGTGLRRQEAVNLNLKDFDPSTGEIKILSGKGEKDRIVYLPTEALPILESWIEVRGRKPGPLLCHVNKADRVVLGKVDKAGQTVTRRLTAQAVLFLLQKRGESAGLAPFSPHDLRRTFISDLLDAGVDIVTVQKLAGHEDPATTSRYDRRGEETKRRAVQHLYIPTRPLGM